MNSKHVGITLAEITIAILIIAVVAAILFPVFAKAREHSWTSCPSNMRQLGLGFIQYEHDYDGQWPGGGDHWAGAIYCYEKSHRAYQCPDDTTASNPPLYPISYAMNANVAGKLQGQLTDPAKSVLATEFDGAFPCDFTKPERASPYATGASLNTAWGGVRLGTTGIVANPPRHQPRSMFLACDAHAILLRPENVSSGLDNSAPHGGQDGTHAAGMKVISTLHYMLTFSEK